MKKDSSMKKIFIFLLLINIIQCSALINLKNQAIQQINWLKANYKQQLIVTQDNMLSISFQIPFKYLPIPLRQVIHQETKVRILYGPYFHRLLHIAYNLSSFNGITTEIRSQSKQYISPQLKQLLQATFSISVSQRYSFLFQQSKSWIFNDPNDKFCSHHINQLIRNILPCGANAGLAQLLDLDTMFSCGESGFRMYGMKILWDKYRMKIKVLVEMDTKIQGIKKIKINEKCLKNSDLIMLDGRNQIIGLKQVALNKLYESDQQKRRRLHNNQLNQLKISRDIVGNWYNFQKDIVITIQSKKIMNYSWIFIRQIIPFRAEVTQIKLINYQKNKSNITQISKCTKQNNYKQPRFKSPSLLCQINLKIVNNIFSQQYQYFSVVISLSTKITNFDNYQSIFGGGTEIPNLPVATIYRPQQFHTMKKFFATPVSLRTPEPDQSLPFQVITFVLGVLGYLWISIWRKLIFDLRKDKQKQKQE